MILTIAEIKERGVARARERHEGVLPEDYRLYFRRYGKHGGRWRGTGPNGWVESDNAELTEYETWWMVFSDDDAKDRAVADAALAAPNPTTEPDRLRAQETLDPDRSPPRE